MDNQSKEYGQSNFSLPHDVVPLPSQGVFYKNKKKSVKVGYLTANDENILLAGGDDMTQNLLRSKIYEPDLRIEDMLEGDVEAILIFLRNTSFGPEYKVQLLDPATNKYFSHTEYLESLNIKQTEHKPDENGLYTTTLPRTEMSVQLRPLTFNEIVELDRQAEEYPVGLIAPKITWRLNKLIVSVNGNNDRGYISKFVDTLPIMDSKHIRNFINNNQPSLDLKRQVIAPSGEKVTFDVSFGAEFFRPFF